MRLLAAIPHHFDATRFGLDGRSHGSLSGNAKARAAALSACIAALHQLYGPAQRMIDIATGNAPLANGTISGVVDLVVCTARGRHCLADLTVPAEAFAQVDADVAPTLLGFECHAALRDRLGDYDFYVYLEDDLIARDPWMFRKLAWFASQVGDEAILQPNRYEVGPLGLVSKAYVDGDLVPELTSRFQDVSQAPIITSTIFDAKVAFRRALNPHAGCFFLNARQMQRWAETPHFLDRDIGFVGPLESAATLGVMKTFRVYKPAIENASFLEIEHAGTAFLGQLRRRDDPGPAHIGVD